MAPDARTDEKDTAPLLDHLGLEILDEVECRALLSSAEVARIALLEDGLPTVFPINIGWWQRDIVFSTERGSKLEAAVNRHTVAVEVDDWDAATRTGWSVLVRGTASLVTDGREIDALDRMAIRSWVNPSVPKHWISVRPASISGRRTVA